MEQLVNSLPSCSNNLMDKMLPPEGSNVGSTPTSNTIYYNNI